MTRRACIYTNDEKQYDKFYLSQFGDKYYNWKKITRERKNNINNNKWS